MSVTFNLWFLKVLSVSNSSALNIGTNLLFGWESYSKEVSGMGGITGDGAGMGALLAAVDDRDWIDTPMLTGWRSQSAGWHPPPGAPSPGSPPLPGWSQPLWPPAP